MTKKNKAKFKTNKKWSTLSIKKVSEELKVRNGLIDKSSSNNRDEITSLDLLMSELIRKELALLRRLQLYPEMWE